ncbi:MAG: helix-turn-helix transcriptional regulator [Methylococcales bacterium]|nr:helix-turn-helix transcriptional regulator [Methylococcales bacterium]
MMPILTGAQFKTARKELGISQLTVAKETGIQRTYLSLFETDKGSFTEEELQTLQDYCSNLGYTFEMTPSHHSLDELSIIDNLQVSSSISHDEQKLLTTGILENDLKIEAISQKSYSTDFMNDFFKEGEIETDKTEVIGLLAKNYLLTCKLQEKELLNKEDIQGQKSISSYVEQHLSL